MKKNQLRTWLACWILGFIALSTVNLSIASIEIHGSFLILFFAMIFIAQTQQSILQLFKAMMVVIGYSAMQFWEIITPIWFLLMQPLLIPLFNLIIICLLAKPFFERLFIAVLGMATGECLYRLILLSYHIPTKMGDPIFYNHLLTTISFLILLEFLRLIKIKLRKWLVAWKQSTVVEARKHIS